MCCRKANIDWDNMGFGLKDVAGVSNGVMPTAMLWLP